MTLSNTIGHRTILDADSITLGLVEVISLTETDKNCEATKKLTKLHQRIIELENNYAGRESARVYFKTEIDTSQLKSAAEKISQGDFKVKEQLLDLAEQYTSKLPQSRDMSNYLP